MQVAIELARRSLQGNNHAEPAPVSRAPNPLRSISGTSRTRNPANESIAEFIRRRDKEEFESRGIR